MTTHVKFSPSQLERYECCPSFFQEKTITLNPAAEEGVRLHEAVATGDLSNLDQDQLDLVNRCLVIKKQALGRWDPEGATSWSEMKYKLGDLTEGTVDLLVVNRAATHAVLIDWKFGQVPVTKAETNIQGQAYAAAVLETFPTLIEIQVQICQPKVDLLTSYLYFRSDLERIKLRIMSIIARAKATSPEETPSEKACSYCDRKSECKALKAIALKAAEGLNLPVPIEMTNTGMTRPVEMAKLQILSQILEDWAVQTRRRNAKCAFEDGIEVPGFEIRTRAGAMGIVDLVSAVKLLQEFGLPLDNILQACTVSLPKLAEQATAVKGGQKAALRKEIEEKLKAFLVQGEQIVFLQKKKGMTYEDILNECRK